MQRCLLSTLLLVSFSFPQMRQGHSQTLIKEVDASNEQFAGFSCNTTVVASLHAVKHVKSQHQPEVQ